MPIVLKYGSLILLKPSGPVQNCNGIALPLPLPLYSNIHTHFRRIHTTNMCNIAVRYHFIKWIKNRNKTKIMVLTISASFKLWRLIKLICWHILHYLHYIFDYDMYLYWYTCFFSLWLCLPNDGLLKPVHVIFNIIKHIFFVIRVQLVGVSYNKIYV